MNKLPYWNIPINIPARYDSDSATAIEQTARVYAKMQELIDNYNAFVDSVNKSVRNIDEQTKKDIQNFENNIIKLMNAFTECIQTKFDEIISNIDDAIEKDKLLGTDTGFNYDIFIGDCNSVKYEAHFLADRTATGRPSVDPVDFYFDVSVSDGLVRQIATNVETGAIYIRLYNGTEWSLWERLATTKFVYDSVHEWLTLEGAVVEGD